MSAFFADILAPKIFKHSCVILGTKISAQNVRVKCWWYRLKEYNLYDEYVICLPLETILKRNNLYNKLNYITMYYYRPKNECILLKWFMKINKFSIKSCDSCFEGKKWSENENEGGASSTIEIGHYRTHLRIQSNFWR